ncbi:LSM14 [Mytilus coruscus]|uniref:LSM14 n=1 Tax=Mytilus coruscus TaxID=42192 RepID=A0A6J8B1J7_MYTCO|nr:LSM14 [Mytilus coruscus]
MRQIESRVTGSEHVVNKMENRFRFITEKFDNMRQKNIELKEKLLEVQSRSMRKNLLFGGILEDPREKEDPDNVEIEAVLKTFIKEKLLINEEIKFHIVHRLRPRKDAKPRTIVANFESRKDRNNVLRAAPAKLKDTSFSVFEQYPYEMRDQRLENHARLKEDKLYVNDNKIYPEDITEARKNAPNVPNNHSSEGNMYPAQQGSQFLREHFGSQDESRAEFEVIHFNPLFSDIHCRLHSNLSAMLPKDLLDKNNSSNVPSKRIRWIDDKRNLFVDSVERKLIIDNLSNQLDTLDITNENF